MKRNQIFKRSLPACAAGCVCLLIATISSPAATFTVTNINDTGPGTLRQAMLDADASLGPHRIEFAISGTGPFVIKPVSQLPTNREPVTIDGYTETGASVNTQSNAFNGNVQICIDGASFSDFYGAGLEIQSTGIVVRGIAFTHWGGSHSAIEITGGASNVIAGCLVGLNPDGSDAHAATGILISGSTANQIGGSNPADRNVISYNWGGGIAVKNAAASNNVIIGNFIGTDLSGTALKINFGSGILIQDAPDNRVGGVQAGGGNVLTGVQVTGSGAIGNILQGNRIGTDVTGTLSLKIGGTGVSLQGALDTLVGGAAPGAGNLICGFGNLGVDIGPGTSGTVLQGNRIGVSATGTALPNGYAGVGVSGTSNLIGGILSGEGNWIALNSSMGVYLADGVQNQIRGNSIYSNASGLGIDLGGSGVTPNDAGDADTGANNFQNFPVITNVTGDASGFTIEGTLNSAPNQSYEVDFFANLDCDGSGNGEGEEYLGTATVLTGASGDATFSAAVNGSADHRFITATATDPDGNTSEFSQCFEAAITSPPMTFTVTNTDDSGPGSLRQAILDSNSHAASENNTIAFDIPGAGVHGIQLLSALPDFAQPTTIDGFTQSGATPNTQPDGNDANWLIELRGVGASFGEQALNLNSPGLVVRGLRITASGGTGITLSSSNCVVAGCFIYSNTSAGIVLKGAVENWIGGTNPADRNVISGQSGGYGIEITDGAANRVLGNFIGPDPNGEDTLTGPYGSRTMAFSCSTHLET